MKRSTTFISQLPNLAGATLDIALQYTATSTTVSYWFTSQDGTGLPVIRFPDGTMWNPSSTAAGSSSTPVNEVTGLSASNTVYFLAKYDPSSDTFDVTYTIGTPPTPTQIAAYNADGGTACVFAATSSSAAITITSGSHGGGVPGGPGGPGGINLR